MNQLYYLNINFAKCKMEARSLISSQVGFKYFPHRIWKDSYLGGRPELMVVHELGLAGFRQDSMTSIYMIFQGPKLALDMIQGILSS